MTWSNVWMPFGTLNALCNLGVIMLSARSGIAIVVLILTVMAGRSIYNAVKTPDSDGLARDSYGTRAYGYRALYETLEALEVPVRRSMVPPPGSLDVDNTLVLVAPSPWIVRNEPSYLRETLKWVERGGQLVLFLEKNEGFWEDHYYNLDDDDDEDRETPQSLLGLSDFGLALASFESIPVPNEDQTVATERHKRTSIARFTISDERETGATTVSLHGELAAARWKPERLRVPVDDLQVFERSTTSSETLTSELTMTSDLGVDYALVIAMRRGEGGLTVVSDSALLRNYLLDKQDNAVLAVNLVGGGQRQVVFDEFYHGLNVKGNPWWLVTQSHYGILLAAIILLMVLWIWREAMVLGPPVSEKVVTRRSLSEYLDAIASVFLRARHRKFLLKEFQTGVLWALRQQLRLPPSHDNLQSIVAALERHEPERASRLEAASRHIDSLVEDRRGISEEVFTHAAREMGRCL